jgi:hypothetical protein
VHKNDPLQIPIHAVTVCINTLLVRQIIFVEEEALILAPVLCVAVEVDPARVALPHGAAAIHTAGVGVRKVTDQSTTSAMVYIYGELRFTTALVESIAIGEPVIARQHLAITLAAHTLGLEWGAHFAAPTTMVHVTEEVDFAPVPELPVAVGVVLQAGPNRARTIHAIWHRKVERAGLAARAAMERVVAQVIIFVNAPITIVVDEVTRLYAAVVHHARVLAAILWVQVDVIPELVAGQDGAVALGAYGRGVGEGARAPALSAVDHIHREVEGLVDLRVAVLIGPVAKLYPVFCGLAEVLTTVLSKTVDVVATLHARTQAADRGFAECLGAIKVADDVTATAMEGVGDKVETIVRGRVAVVVDAVAQLHGALVDARIVVVAVNAQAGLAVPVSILVQV